MLAAGYFYCIIVFCLVWATVRSRSIFYIGGLFPVDVEDRYVRLADGLYPRVAAELAVEDINSKGILSPYNVTVQLEVAGSGCSSATSVSSYVQLMQSIRSLSTEIIYNHQSIPSYVVLGPACEDATFSSASLTSRYTRDIEVSYAASTLLLASVRRYPLFYRTVPSYSEYSRALYAIMREFKWWNIAVIHKELPHYTRAVENLANYFDTQNREGRSPEDTSLEGGDQKARIVSATSLNGFLERHSAPPISTRIYVAMVPESEVAVLLCSAFLLGLTGQQYQWIFLGENYSKKPWKSWIDTKIFHRKLQCSVENMTAAAEAAIFITHHQPVESPEVSSTLSQEQVEFWNKLKQKFNSETQEIFQVQWSTNAMATYDAVWTIAYALEKVFQHADSATPSEISTVSADDNNLVDRTNIRPFRIPISPAVAALNAAMEKTDFQGLTSRIRFSAASHSLQDPIAYILQLQAGEMVPIGRYIAANDTTDLTLYGNAFVWKGSILPRDRPLIILQVASIYVVCAVLGIGILGIVFSVVVLGINCAYRKHKVIKASSPYLNFLIVTGCMLGFLSIGFMSVENLDVNFRVPVSAYSVLCNIRPFMLSAGFTLSFGALFAKTFRIYLVFRDPWTRRRAAKDSKLFATVGILLAYDVLISVLWVFISPLSLVRVTINYDPTTFTEDLYCFCAHKSSSSSGVANVHFLAYIGLITVPNAVLLAFGIFLVFQTSKIKAVFFKDAKYTGIAIFGVMIACGIGVPTGIFTMISFQENITYIASSSTILVCSFLILVMVFVPKFSLLRKYRKRVPARVLIGLNPSFRVTRNVMTRGTTTSLQLYGMTIRNQNKANSTRKYCNKPGVYAPHIKSKQFGQVYGTLSAAKKLDSLASHDDLIRVQPKKKMERVESMQNWWESAFDDNSSKQSNAEVQETAVSFQGYQGIISVLNMRRTPADSETSSCDSPITPKRCESERRTNSKTGSYLSTITEMERESPIGDGGSYDNDDGSNSHTPHFHFTSYHIHSTNSSLKKVDIGRSKSFSCVHSVSK